MATDERNFRSPYYEKVGCRVVEEKKSLEMLMKETPWDRIKLKQFCLRFTVPAAYRNLVWKVLLGILPLYPEAHSFVSEQRTAQYDDLMYALDAMGIVTEDTPRVDALLEAWQLETDRDIPVDDVVDPNFSLDATFKPITTTLLELYEDEVDVFWLTKAFCTIVHNFQRDIPKLCEIFRTVLEKKDMDLYNHLIDINSLDALPLNKWFNSCFAGVIQECYLTKIWDKLCGGAPKVLPYVAVMLVITLRRNILKAKTPDDVLKCISEMTENCEEVISNKAIELWQYCGTLAQGDQIAKK